MSVKVVGIAGITGKFARCILDNLLKDPSVSIQGYCRDPTKLPDVIQSSSRVQITKGESTDNASLRSFVRSCDVVICCYLGDNSLMIDGQKALVDACEAEGVPRYVASDYSLDFRKLGYGQLPAKDPMKYIQEYIESKPNVTGVHVLIGVFMDIFFFSVRIFKFSTLKPRRLLTGERDKRPGRRLLMRTPPNLWQLWLWMRMLSGSNNVSTSIIFGEFCFQEELIIPSQSSITLKRLGSLEDLYNHMHQVRNEDPNNIFAYLAM